MTTHTADRAARTRLTRLDHRPWELPAGRWTWRQSWQDLLFAHWPVAAAALRPLVPPELTIEEKEGSSWVGLVPFRMADVTRRPFPSVPWLSAFPELNLRLYVSDGRKPGVWFLSLDAANPVAVWAARRFFHLPYFHARMRCTPSWREGAADAAGPGEGARDSSEGITYASERRAAPVGPSFRARYRPTSPPYEASPGSLEHWLTERYCLYAMTPDGSLKRTEIHHGPWPLQAAEVEIERNGLAEPHGLELTGAPALLHFARRLDVRIWPTEPLASG